MDFDDAYDNVGYIPDAGDFIERWARDASAYRGRMDASGTARLGLIYGDSPRQALDLFLPEETPTGLVVFVHGGYWRRFDRTMWSHFAEGCVARGWAVAMPSYDLCPGVRISDITRQIARAIVMAAELVQGPIRLTGHSAGGHLVARMGMAGVLPEKLHARIAHILPISALGDLRPLLHTAMNDDFQLDEVEATAESPTLHPAPDVPVSVWVGGEERPAFIDQSRWLADAWQAELKIAPGRHHFDVIDPLCDPDSGLVSLLLEKS